MEEIILDVIESRTRNDLMALQAQPLEVKVALAKKRIKDFYEHFNGRVCVSFSGGKDSTVLLDLVRQRYPDVRAVFSDTGLEYPEIRAFARGFDNVDVVRPSMRFDQVISTYGYPLISKEVAEAISYARRIRSQSLNVERERERGGADRTSWRHAMELMGYRRNGAVESCWGARSAAARSRSEQRALDRKSWNPGIGSLAAGDAATELDGRNAPPATARGCATSQGRDADSSSTDSEPG